MAHTITGIDIGSHSVKLVSIEVGFRQSRLLSTLEQRVPTGEAPLAERQAEALQAALARLQGEQSFFAAVPGDELAVRVLDLPFAEARKIEQVVGFELEGQIVHALDDVVYDHVSLEAPSDGPGSSVMAVAARTEDIGSLLAELKAQNVEPRALFAAPVVYQALFTEAAAPAEEGATPGFKVLIDVGHRRTNVCFLWQGQAVFARTISRGGAAVTAALARLYQCDEARAEGIKHEHGFVASAGRPAGNDAHRQIDTAVREALAPLLRELRQTLASHVSRWKAPIDGVLLTGGSAALVGLPEFLQEELELPVSLWAPGSGAGPDPDALAMEGATAMALAQAVAWAGARGDRQIDLRRGPFVYKASFSVLRQRAGRLAALGAAVLVTATLDVTMSMTRLSSQRTQLEAELKAATTELFGAPRMDGREVATLLRNRFKDEMAPMPKATAFDLLDQISRKIPIDLKIDVYELDVRPKKTFIKGTIASAAALDEMVDKLKEIDCFEEINKGPLQETSAGKNFTLTIASKCP
jgi:general secretion pathway protein L